MDISFFLKAVTAFFVIIDPIGMCLLFHALTHGIDAKGRRLTALKACLISATMLVLFGMYGEVLLAYLGISINALKISGGILLFYTAFKMVTSSLHFQPTDLREDVSVFPLSIPLLAGPGSLTVSILLFADANEVNSFASVIAAILLILSITFGLMYYSHHIRRIFSSTGDEVLRRFLGVLLAALAIQFIIDGLLGANLSMH